MENETTIESLREEIAAKDAALAEMKAAADAQHAEAEKLGKLAEEAATAGKAVAIELDNAKAEFAAQLAEKDKALAERDAAFAEARSRWESDMLAARKTAEDAAATAKADFSAQLAAKDAEIANLKAAAKTAEQIAAEKYGAATKPIANTPSGDVEALRERARAALNSPSAFASLAKDLSKEQIRALR